MRARVGRLGPFLLVIAAAAPGLSCTERVRLLAAEAADAEEPSPPPPEDAAAPADRRLEIDTPPAPRDAEVEAPKCDEFTQNVRLEFENPEVVIALDRSFSMFAHKPGEKTWQQWAKQEVSSYVRANEGAIAFGYEEFPGRATCDQMSACCGSRVLVPPYLNSHWQIEHEWKCDGTPGCYETTVESPSGDALSRIRAFYDREPDPALDRFVLVITDGSPSCAVNPHECDDAGRQAARLFSMGGIKTLVLPIGDEAKKSACLEAVAVMGQTRAPGATDFPAVLDPGQLGAQLKKAMAPIEERACRYLLRGSIGDRDKLTVTVNYMPLARDPAHKEGWDFDPTGTPEIQLFGSACKKLKCNEIDSRAVKAQMVCMQCGSTITCP
jgi:hypothetical protein